MTGHHDNSLPHEEHKNAADQCKGDQQQATHHNHFHNEGYIILDQGGVPHQSVEIDVVVYLVDDRPDYYRWQYRKEIGYSYEQNA
jgi:hypothetical protein